MNKRTSRVVHTRISDKTLLSIIDTVGEGRDIKNLSLAAIVRAFCDVCVRALKEEGTIPKYSLDTNFTLELNARLEAKNRLPSLSLGGILGHMHNAMDDEQEESDAKELPPSMAADLVGDEIRRMVEALEKPNLAIEGGSELQEVTEDSRGTNEIDWENMERIPFSELAGYEDIPLIKQALENKEDRALRIAIEITFNVFDKKRWKTDKTAQVVYSLREDLIEQDLSAYKINA